MRLTIVRRDNVVVMDGRGLVMDLVNYPFLKGIHAVQWDGTSGQVEYENDGKTAWSFRLNDGINDISKYQAIINAWKVVAAAEDSKPKPVLHDPTIGDNDAKH